jgi:uncharacterized protein involved in outer membrane biogenesis
MARRRRLVLKLLLAITALLAVAVGLFASLEPAEIGAFLQSRLSKALKRPVTVGQIRVNVSQGLAFEVQDVTVGTLDKNAERLEIPSLFVKPKLLPLLIGRLSFAQFICESPVLVFDLGHKKEKTINGPSEKPKKVFKFPLQTLTLSNGTLKVLDSSGVKLTTPLVLKNIHGNFRLTAKPSRTGFSITGKLLQGDHICHWSFRGHISEKTETPGWEASSVYVVANLGKFLPETLFKKVPFFSSLQNSAGSLELRLEASGVPAQGLSIETVLDGENLRFQPPGYRESGIAIDKARFTTLWTHAQEEDTFDNTAFEINGVSLTGKVRLARKENVPWMAADFSSPAFPIDRLHTFFPHNLPFVGPEGWNGIIPKGSVQVSSLAYAGPLSLQFPENLSEISAQVKFSKGEILLPRTEKLEDFRFEANLADNTLTLKNGNFICREVSMGFRGIAKNLFQANPDFQFEARGTLPAEKLLDLPGFSATDKVKLAGRLPLQFLARGGRDKLFLDFKADISGLEAAAGELALKKTAEPGHLEISATTDFQTWTLEKADLTTDLIHLQTQGHGNLRENRGFNIQMALLDLEMEKIPRSGKVLERLQPKGKISFVQDWAGENGKVSHSLGTLTLEDAGVHLTSILADLNSINGTVDFSEGRAAFRNVIAQLGTSPIMVSGSVADVRNPELHLTVKSPHIRADELIFRSDQYYLYDLDGILTIDKNQIRFDEVHTALEQGTLATVKGYVTFTKNPETRLFITSKNAVIDEVIALWSKPAKRKKPTPKKRGKKVRLLIDVEAEKGVIDNFHFQKAKGQIRLKDNILVIHPLDFHSGPGYGNGQVLLVDDRDHPSLLKISGHVENFDAEAVSTELIRHGSLVSGTLRGDFYLEGRVGSTFLPTSRGEFNVEIRKGVLKKFEALSKVFSLLNISQILALKIPDMATDGMPFNRATGTVQMRQGLLSSENVWVDSEAMNLSLVGNMNLVEKKTDVILVVKPLGTVDKIITKIPVAGWILAGEDKALVTAHFQIKGKTGAPEVEAIPMTSISRKAQGIFRRIFKLPEKMISDTEELFREKENP